MIDTKTIKDRILSFAYQGKLIETNKLSNDNIESIYDNIKGYIPVSEEEYLIDAPEAWKWTRLGYVTSNHGQVTPSDTFSYIDVGTLDNVNHRLSSSENIVEAKDAPSRAKKVVESGDVIYSTVRPYLHNICIIDKDFSYTPIASTAFCVMHANEKVLDNRFLFFWLLTKEFDKYSNGDSSKGALYPAIGERDLLKGVIPLPAVSEQKAIVAKIEAIFEILDKIDVLQDQYAFNQEALKGKLIDAAIQGKLTKQLPEDGTADDLYQQVQSEKKKLQEDRKIKKSKILMEITDEEIPFELPSNWKWVRLGSVLNEVIVPQRDKPKRFDGDIPWCRIEDADGDYMSKSHSNQNVSQETVDEMNLRIFPTGTILSACSGGSIGRILITTTELCTNQTFNGLVCSMGLYNRYLFHFLRNSIGRLKKLGSGAAMEYVSQKKIGEMLIPLPPLSEQHRIVEKLDTMLSLIA